MDESFLMLRRGPLSRKTVPWKIIGKVLSTILLLMLILSLPLTFIENAGSKRKVLRTDYWDVPLLESNPSERGEIYRFIQRFHTGLTDEEELDVTDVIYNESRKYNCDPKLVLSLIMVESSFYSKATSHKGAKGLMQLRPYVAKSLAKEMGIEWNEDAVIYIPEVNIRLGLYYLSRLILQFKDLKIAITAYNFGPTYIRQRMSEGKPLPTWYANKVLRNYQKLSKKDRKGSAESL